MPMIATYDFRGGNRTLVNARTSKHCGRGQAYKGRTACHAMSNRAIEYYERFRSRAPKSFEDKQYEYSRFGAWQRLGMS